MNLVRSHRAGHAFWQIGKKKEAEYYFNQQIKYSEESIRKEERFQKILQTIELKYQAEHERVRKWLEEQGMI